MSGSSKGQSNLMDDDDHESIGPSHPALAPQRTGAVMQSNNPFLSPGETEEQVSLPSTPDQQPRNDQQGSSLTPRDSPGSSRTQYQSPSGPPPDKGLPAIPDSNSPEPTTYDPPPGVPPRPPGSEVGMGRPPPLPQRNVTAVSPQGASSPSRESHGLGQSPRPLPIPQNTQPPSLPRRNISSQIYSASNPPQSSFPHHSPIPKSPSPSFFPPQQSASPQSAALHRAISTHHGGENPLDMLRDFHTVFLGELCQQILERFQMADQIQWMTVRRWQGDDGVRRAVR